MWYEFIFFSSELNNNYLKFAVVTLDYKLSLRGLTYGDPVYRETRSKVILIYKSEKKSEKKINHFIIDSQKNCRENVVVGKHKQRSILFLLLQ